MTDSLIVTLDRGTATQRHRQSFTVPAQKNQTILDVVTWIQQNADPALTYRFACRVGMCGSCAMTVNGTPRWTCRTHVSKVARRGRLTIGPLRNLPIIKDLATDMDPFFDKWTASEARHHPSATRYDPMPKIKPATRAQAAAGIECINCAVCYAACDTVGNVPAYPGPAALQRAHTLIADEKDAGTEVVLSAITGEGGLHSCHSIGACTQACPNALDPMSAIATLKRKTALR